MDSVALNIAIAPPRDIIVKAIEISKALEKEGSLFVLNETLYSTHITLYMAEFPEQNLEAICDALEKLSTTIKPFSITSMEYKMAKDGYTDVEYECSDSILKLHTSVIDAVNPFREELIRSGDIIKLDSLLPEQRENIKRCGFRDAFDLYRPHLTFTKLSKYKEEVLENLKQQDFSFKVDTIGLFCLGENGTSICGMDSGLTRKKNSVRKNITI